VDYLRVAVAITPNEITSNIFEGSNARVLLIDANFDHDWPNNHCNSHPLKEFSLNWKKSFLSPQATIMENKAPQDTTAKSSLGLLIVEGGFDDQVCVIPG
jgi:hypothetical protein